MERLNIPFKSGKTTRPNRRVVSTSLVLAGVILFGAFAFVRLVLGRSTLLALAPYDAEVIDIVGRSSLLSVAEHFGEVPLLTDRPITLNAILADTRGEAELIILSNGERVLAYRGQVSNAQKAFYETLGVLVEVRGGTVLLSSSTNARSQLKEGRVHIGFSSILPGFFGFFRDGGKQYGLYMNAKGVRAGFVTLFDRRLPTLPAATIAFTQFSGENQAISSYIAALSGSGLFEAMHTLLSGRNGSLLLTHDDQGVGYRLTIEERVDSEVLTKLLQTSAALAHPTTKTVALRDGSYVDELEVDPSTVVMNVEEREDGVFITADQGDIHLRARQTAKETTITNRDGLLEEPNMNEELVLACGAKAETLVLPESLANVVTSTATTTDKTASQLTNFKELLILDKKFSICW